MNPIMLEVVGTQARLSQFHYTSPSQLGTHATCPRKWWVFKRLKFKGPDGNFDQGLPEPDRPYFAFGNAFHGVIERYMMADDAGYIEVGPPVEPSRMEPVELFPQGWDKDLWEKSDSRLIRELIEEGIDKGFIARHPDRLIEFSLKDRPVGETGIKLWAFADLLVPPGHVYDWKTPKLNKYRLSAKKMLENDQVIIYSHEVLNLCRERGQVLPAKVTFEFVYFCKDPKLVKGKRVSSRKAELEPALIEERMAQLIEETERMKLTAGIQDYWTVPAVFNSTTIAGDERGCMAYGKCPLLSVCSRHETLQHYIDRVHRANANRGKINHSVQPKETTPMEGIFAQGLRGKTPAKKEEVAKAADVASGAQATSALIAPWAKHTANGADKNCIACGGKGYNTQGNPCRVCDKYSESTAGRPTSAWFAHFGQVWTLREDHAKEWLPEWGPTTNATTGEAPPPTSEEANAAAASIETMLGEGPSDDETSEAHEEAPDEAPPPAAEPVPDPAVAAAAAAQPAAAAPEPDPAAVAPKKGRKPQGFKLLIGCVGIKLPKGAPVMTITHLLDEVIGPRVAAANGVASYYQVDGFLRKDWVSKLIGNIGEELGRTWIVANVKNMETSHLVVALSSHPCCDLIVQATIS